MALHMVSDGALGGARLPVGGVGGWLTSYVNRGELVLSLGCDLAATVRGILRRASRTRAAKIRVRAMSDTWLQTHETEHDKRCSEL